MFDSTLDTEQVFGHSARVTRPQVRRRRVTLTAAAVLATLALLGPVSRAVAGPGAVPRAPSDMRPAALHSYVVRSGDTVWSIAGRLAPGADPRVTVTRILAANRVDPGSLRPGQVLVLPSLA